MDGEVKLKWYCGMFLGPSHLDGSNGPECNGEGVYELQSYQEEDWEEGLSPCIECYKCGQMLDDLSHYSIFDPDDGCDPWLAPPGWEPPLPDDEFYSGDHVLFEGGVWKVEKESKDEYDDREQKLDIRWVAGQRTGRMIYATGIRSSDLKKLTEMEVIAWSSR